MQEWFFSVPREFTILSLGEPIVSWGHLALPVLRGHFWLLAVSVPLRCDILARCEILNHCLTLARTINTCNLVFRAGWLIFQAPPSCQLLSLHLGSTQKECSHSGRNIGANFLCERRFSTYIAKKVNFEKRRLEKRYSSQIF